MHESDRTESTQKRESNITQDETAALQLKPTPPSLTPSSSRPPPIHPILKKPRGPSNSGPRPTARFVNVPDSEDDNAQQSSSSQQSGSGASQSDSSARSRNAARPSSRSKSPAKVDKKSATAKKFVASSTTSKRRPVLPRRQSSQSSTGSVGSDNGSRDGSSSAKKATHQQEITASPQEESLPSRLGNTGLPMHVEEPAINTKEPGRRSQKEGNPTIVRTSPQPGTRGGASAIAQRRTPSPLSQGQNMDENNLRLPDSLKGYTPSAKVLGKQPMNTLGSAITSPTRSSNPLGIYDSTAEPTGAQGITDYDNWVGKADKGKSAEIEKAAGGETNPNAAPTMVRSNSNTESKRMSSGPVAASNFKSPSVVGMSNLAVSGGFDFETPRARPSEEDLPPLSADQPDLRKSSVLDSKLSPTQPSSNPAPSMARSKSQLTLLLERDKARIGDKHKVGGSNSLQKGNSKDESRKRG